MLDFSHSAIVTRSPRIVIHGTIAAQKTPYVHAVHGQAGKNRTPHRRESQGALRVFHRGALRGWTSAAGLGSEGHARGSRAAKGSIRFRARRRSVSLRRAYFAA